MPNLEQSSGKTVWVSLSLICIVAIFLGTAAEVKKQSAQRFRLVRSPESATLPGGLFIHGWIEMQSDQSAHSLIRVAIQNRTPDPISGLTIRINAAGLRFAGDCWHSGNVLSCSGGNVVGSLAIESGKPVVLQGKIRTAVSGIYKIIGQAEWTDKSGSQSYPFELGTYEFSLPAKSWLVAFFAAFKDLALPTILLLGGWFFKEFSEKKERHRQSAENKKERDHRGLEAIKAQEHKILNDMLAIMIEFSKKYYFHVLQGASRMRENLGQKQIEARPVLLELLKFRLVMRRLSDKEGGIFLKSREAEEVFSECWDEIRERSKAILNEEKMLTAARLIAPRERLDVFSARFDAESAQASSAIKNAERAEEQRRAACREAALLADLESQLGSWLDSIEEVKQMRLLFEGLYEVLLFEINRPLASWYRPGTWHSSVAPIEEVETLLATLTRMESNNLSEEIANKTAKYKAYLRPPRPSSDQPGDSPSSRMPR